MMYTHVYYVMVYYYLIPNTRASSAPFDFYTVWRELNPHRVKVAVGLKLPPHSIHAYFIISSSSSL